MIPPLPTPHHPTSIPPRCDHWQDKGSPEHGICRLGLYGGRPSLGTCAGCPRNTAAGSWPLLPPPAPPSPHPPHPPTAEELADDARLREVIGEAGEGEGGGRDETLLGNRIEDLAQAWGVDRVAAALGRLGIRCGCAWRRDVLNAAHEAARAAIAWLRG